MKPPPDAVHLGDGAYVSFDRRGWQLILWAEREESWHYVALEMSALIALNDYAKRARAAPR